MTDHILVAADGSMSSVRHLESAARLAKDAGARLTIISPFPDRPLVHHDTPGSSPGRSPRAAAEALAHAAAQHAQLVADGGLDVDARAHPGNTALVLSRAIQELGPDVVVIANVEVRRALDDIGGGASTSAPRMGVTTPGLRALRWRRRGLRRLTA